MEGEPEEVEGAEAEFDALVDDAQIGIPTWTCQKGNGTLNDWLLYFVVWHMGEKAEIVAVLLQVCSHFDHH